MHTLLLNKSNMCLLQETSDVHCDEDSFSTAEVVEARLSHSEDSLQKNFAPINYC